MGILNVLPAGEIVRAASMADVNAFTRVPGVGRKTAERLCFELKSSLAKEFASALPGAAVVRSRVSDTVGDALRSLGFSQDDVVSVLAIVQAAWGDDYDKMDEEGLLKAALKELQRR
jgi:Holliday junction DNA helicase RuvA